MTGVCLMAAAMAAATVINVEPGPDALPKAQQKIRELMRKDPVKTRLGGVEVVLADGVYRLSRPLSFTEIDCGTNGIPVVWRGAHRGKAIISGAVDADPVAIDWSRPPSVVLIIFSLP